MSKSNVSQTSTDDAQDAERRRRVSQARDHLLSLSHCHHHCTNLLTPLPRSTTSLFHRRQVTYMYASLRTYMYLLPVCIIFFPAALLVAKYVLAPLQHFILIHLSSRAGNVQHWHGGHGPPPTAVCTLRPRQYLIYLGLTKNTRRRQLRYTRTRRSCRLARRRHLGCANASRLLCGLQEVCSTDIRCA